MIIINDAINNAAKAAMAQLNRTGATFNNEDLVKLTSALTSIVTASGAEIRENVDFKDLSGEQWMEWMTFTRDSQAERGEDPESISSEEAEVEAEHHFAILNGLLPVKE